MYVCICNGITDSAIRDAAADGVRSLAELTMRTGCAGTCGSCADFAEQVLREAIPRNAKPFGLALVAAAA
ncbi:(2Fe-2S)-binding protein [Tahibacter amnicola]|uniref:Bacterioferritin-associated ferredoxin n=1 Tax=Tahibacter amnicola TaxID=2976241 RepID=A0ABY6BI34_9GAMM|nr:(2Fe-2S)-binding protein [Tahibacter amnicola]UXI68750.1 (2Fe-2S)-binding protein [Tahibacter amnicola]